MQKGAERNNLFFGNFCEILTGIGRYFVEDVMVSLTNHELSTTKKSAEPDEAMEDPSPGSGSEEIYLVFVVRQAHYDLVQLSARCVVCPALIEGSP
jgi:hypothetical protein